ncbi:MAG: twitching motility protein PilT [Candidatus Sericytochromatia bacterium]|nr:twitching motility protein PilT [Candidatus Tanganyikabacteria bacterium]
MTGITYDTGALVAGERNDRRAWALHARTLERGILPIVPSVVLAEAWRGGPQANLARLLDGCLVEALDESSARAAGAALKRSSTDDVSDAVVVTGALHRGDAVVTSDRRDLERLSDALGKRLAIIDV